MIQIQEGLPTFSFFNYLFINPHSLSQENRRKIFAHEKIHIQQCHSLDLCIAEIICIANWFNPFVCWKLSKKVLFPHFVLSFGTHPCVFYYADGLFLPGMRWNPKSSGIAFREIFVCAVDFPMIFYAAVVFAWFMISQTIDASADTGFPSA